MPPPRTTPRATDVPAEKLLFDAADDLRSSVESSEYKHLGLVFLKYVSDGFEARRQALDALTRDAQSEWFVDGDQERAEILEDRDAYEVVTSSGSPRRRAGMRCSRSARSQTSASSSTRRSA